MIKYFLLVIVLIASINNKSLAQSKDEKEVATAVENFRKALIDGDSTQLNMLTSDSITYGHSSGLVQRKPEFIHSFTSGASDFVTIDLQDQTIQLFDNTAIVRNTLTAQTNDNNKPGNVKLKILMIWQKQKGKWILIARQGVHANEQ